MKKISAYILTAVISLGSFTAAPSSFAQTPKNTAEQTVFIYMIGSDMTAFANSDISEMLGSGFNSNDANVILIAGGSMNEDCPSGIFRLTDNSLDKLESATNYNLFDTDDIYDIMFRYMARYRAEKYSVFFWDHGGGYFNGYGMDDSGENDPISIQKLAEVFSDIKKDVKNDFGLQYNYETIGFDACLMADIQTEKAFADAGFRYFIGSESVANSVGWDYSFLSALNDNPYISGDELCRIIIDTSFDYNVKNGIKKRSVISCSDLSKTDKVIAALNSTSNNITSDNADAAYSAKHSALSYGASGEYIDIADYAERLEAAGFDTTELSEAVSDAVIYRSPDSPGGITVFGSDDKQLHASWNRMTDSDLDDYKAGLQLLSNITPSSYVIPEISGGNILAANSVYTYEMDDTVARDTYSAQLAVYKAENGIYRRVFVTDDVKISDSTLTASYDNISAVLRSDSCSYPCELKIQNGKYYVDIVKDTGNCGALLDLRPIKIELDKDGSIINTEYSDNKALAAKDDASLLTGDRIYTSAECRNTDNTLAETIPDMFTVHDPSFEISELQGEYLCRFELINAYGYIEHYSPMSEIKTETSDVSAITGVMTEKPEFITAGTDKISVPCTINDLAAMGYVSDNIPANIDIGEHYATMHNGDTYIDIRIENTGTETASSENCIITVVSVTNGVYGTLTTGSRYDGSGADRVYITRDSVRYLYRLGEDSVLPDFSGDLGLNGFYYGIYHNYVAVETSREDGTIRRITLASGGSGSDYKLKYFIY
ncbi:MAG: hypothetical protein J1G06_08035 [Oscillospiraceae bacterium]|nr:hypothetical protein [Oscillospiraceae bacterium]